MSLLLAACGEEETPESEAPADATPEATPEGLRLSRVAFADLPDWRQDDLDGVLQAMGRSCAKLTALPDDRDVGAGTVALRAGDFDAACDALPEAEGATPGAIRAHFERHYVPFATVDRADGSAKGLFTGYFEAELTGSRTRSETFSTPLYGVPDDLVRADLGQFREDLAGTHLVGTVADGRFVPYPPRGAIENGHLAGRDLEILWIDDPLDVFLLQVQGSGRVVLPNGDPPGEVVRVGFAAHNGRPYRSIGKALIERGDLEPHEASWDGIRDWLEANPDKRAELFAENPRFIFFREIDGDGPIGAQGVALTPKRSLAVDRAHVPLGLPIWLDTLRPGHDGDDPDAPVLRRLMVAQDTGGAITGPIRGDFFWGYGDAALAEAGRMRSPGRYFLLLPRPAAERMVPPAS